MWPFKKKTLSQAQPRTVQDGPFGEKTSALVIEMAKSLMASMQSTAPGWRQAFYRLEASDDYTSSSGSYVEAERVCLLDVFSCSELYESLEPHALSLRELLQPHGEKFRVLLLTATSEFDYTVDYEWNNPNRWRISKMDGGTGIPEGK